MGNYFRGQDSDSDNEEENQDQYDNLIKKKQSGKGPKTNYHKPTPMKEDDIFKLYTEMIENDFANNQHQYQNTIKNKQSVLAAVK